MQTWADSQFRSTAASQIRPTFNDAVSKSKALEVNYAKWANEDLNFEGRRRISELPPDYSL
jgi:hypothetical protein